MSHDRPGDAGAAPGFRTRSGRADRVEGVRDEVVFTWGMPLWHCARHGKHAMAEMLLERGADPNGAECTRAARRCSEAYGQRD